MRLLMFIGGGFIGVLWVSVALAQPYRDNLPLPSLEINRLLLAYAVAEDFEKFSRTLPVVKSLTDTFKIKFGSDVESELRSSLGTQDPANVLKATQHLVYLDLKDLMTLGVEMMGDSPDKAKAKMKAAYLNYLLLSPFIQTANFTGDQRIKKNFRTVTLTLDFSATVAGSQETIKRLVGEIDKELAATLAVSH